MSHPPQKPTTTPRLPRTAQPRKHRRKIRPRSERELSDHGSLFESHPAHLGNKAQPHLAACFPVPRNVNPYFVAMDGLTFLRANSNGVHDHLARKCVDWQRPEQPRRIYFQTMATWVRSN